MNALQHLLANPTCYQLGPTIRLLGMTSSSIDPLGGGDWDAAMVRIRHHDNPSIALHEVQKVHRLSDQSFELFTPVLNVTGVTGLVPDWRRQTKEDLNAFDRITHRLIADWYETWRSEANSEPCAFHRPRSAAGLEAMLASALRLPICIKESIRGWTTCVDEFGRQHFAVDPSNYCELTLGPVRRKEFDQLMPGAPLLKELYRLARKYSGPVVRFRINVILQQEDVETARRDIDRYDRGAVIGEPRGDVLVRLHEYELEGMP